MAPMDMKSSVAARGVYLVFGLKISFFCFLIEIKLNYI